MGRDSAYHVSEPVKPKSKSAALGFRVKSSCAVAALVAGPVRSPRLCDSRMIDLSDARFPETRQPYHAATGKLETDPVKIRARLRIVRRIARQSIAKLHAEYRGFVIRRAALIIGSQIILLQSQIRIFARTRSKGSYFAPHSMTPCAHTGFTRSF
jgi:hypothetical protein